MTDILQHRKGSTAENDLFTGALAELSVDIESKSVRVHDGVKVGGYEVGMPQAKSIVDLRSNVPTAGAFRYLKYHTTQGDGGHGVFRAVAGKPAGHFTAGTGIEPDNNGTIIVPTGGDGSAAWVRSFTGAVNVKWFNAIGDSATDNTSIFLAASKVSNNVFVPKDSAAYFINRLYVARGVVIWGDGDILTSSGSIIHLNKVNITVDDTPMKIIFADSYYSWEELLDMKNTGFNTIMGYENFDTTANLVASAEAVGLKILVHSKIDPANIIYPISPKTSFDSSKNVIGHYILDEPLQNNTSLIDQEAIIAAYRAATDKPLYIAANAVFYETISTFLSPNYDVIFSDQYYSDASALAFDKANLPLSNALRNNFEYQFSSGNTKIIPLLGLFNTIGFTQSTANTIKLANDLLPTTRDGSFGVFLWDSNPAVGSYVGVRNNAAYRNAAINLSILVQSMKPYEIIGMSVGTGFGGSNKLLSYIATTKDSLVQGVKADPSVFVFDIINVGVATDARHQAFAETGLAITGSGGRIMLKNAPSGLAAMRLVFTNHYNAATLTLNFGGSENAGLTVTNVKTGETLPSSWIGQMAVDMRNTPTIEFNLSQPVPPSYAFVKGYFVFSDIPYVNY